MGTWVQLDATAGAAPQASDAVVTRARTVRIFVPRVMPPPLKAGGARWYYGRDGRPGLSDPGEGATDVSTRAVRSAGETDADRRARQRVAPRRARSGADDRCGPLQRRPHDVRPSSCPGTESCAG